ncbi:MAG: hypothetical protein GEV08_25590 [Acidimicrobiia bacterium]|nr:hypothetical protein [Acidimicrobiia bacterium]
MWVPTARVCIAAVMAAAASSRWPRPACPGRRAVRRSPAATAVAVAQPEDGATVSTPFDAVALEFDELVSTPEVTVTDPTGADIADGDPQVDGGRLTQPLGPLEDTGRYTVAYQVLSADDHPAFGEIAFTYTGPTGDEPVDGARPPAAPDDAGPAPAGDGEPAASRWPLLGGQRRSGRGARRQRLRAASADPPIRPRAQTGVKRRRPTPATRATTRHGRRDALGPRRWLRAPACPPSSA